MPMGVYPRPPVKERFWAKVNKNGKVRVESLGPCWEWTGATAKKGYGNFNANGKTTSAHRYSYILHNGDLPKGKQVNHKCNYRKCVNPDHMYAGTQTQNLRDREKFGTTPRGSTHKNTKLSAKDVKAIYGDKRKGVVIAEEYGVSPALVSMVRSGRYRTDDLNAGGVVHSKEEIDKVKALLEKERNNK